MSFIATADDEIIGKLHQVVAAFKGCEHVQVLGTTKRGSCGVSNINMMFHSLLSQNRRKVDGWRLAEGDPVIYLKNDYEKELWNGSLGRINLINTEVGRAKSITLSCTFEGDNQIIEYGDLDKLALAYAITVHKAQGSQFQRVIIPIVKSKLLDRALIYTALTRGIEQVVFIGNRAAFDQAIIERPKSHNRMVGLSV